MTLEEIQNVVSENLFLFIPIVIILSYFLYRISRFILGRLSYRIALRTENVYDDLPGFGCLHRYRSCFCSPSQQFGPSPCGQLSLTALDGRYSID